LNPAEKIAFKQALQQAAVQIIEARMAHIVASMEAAQAAANNEEKSSAGDKYETSRAMSHIEKDLQAGQLQSNKQELAALTSIDCSALQTTARAGACIQAGDFYFFIAAGLGKQEIDGKTVFFLSAHAPLALSLLNRKEGDCFLFGVKNLRIENLF
jgi:hypothetical protein